MKRVLPLSALALAAVACSTAPEKPGATLHGPGALAIVDAIVDHGSGSQRAYLFIANQRGDELRLIDTTDNDVVTSPGLVFPLAIPTAGRPMLLAAADLGDGLPDALAVVSAGSDAVELVRTWDGHPEVFDSVNLAGLADPRNSAATLGDVEVLSIVATPEPGVTGLAKARFVVGLLSPTGANLAVIRVQRPALAVSYEVLDVSVMALAFDPVGLAAGSAPEVVYAATGDAIETTAGSGTFVHGVVKITIPATGPVPAPVPLDAGVPTEAVAVVSGTPDRVIALPRGGDCGASCGLLQLDPVSGLKALPPIQVPGFVVALDAVGRSDGTMLSIFSGGAPLATRGIAVASSSDGGIYMVDVDRWALVGPTLTLAGPGRTQVSAAAPVPGSASQLGLWPLFGDPGVPVSPSTSPGELASRIRVTPGFTPDDTWTLTYQGILPGLGGLAAQLSWSPPATLTVTVPAESVAALAADAAAVGDDVTLFVLPAAGDPANVVLLKACLDGATLNVTALASGVARLALPTCPAPLILADVPAFTDDPATASFRAEELVLVGSAWGYAGRPAAVGLPPALPPVDASGEFTVAGPRLFDVGLCAGDATCDPAWESPPFNLTFPLPTGPALGLTPVYVNAAGSATATPPSRDTAITFTTTSGRVVPYARRPIHDGTALSSALPTGLVFVPFASAPDPVGVSFFTGYTSGLVMGFSTAFAPSEMSIIR